MGMNAWGLLLKLLTQDQIAFAAYNYDDDVDDG